MFWPQTAGDFWTAISAVASLGAVAFALVQTRRATVAAERERQRETMHRTRTLLLALLMEIRENRAILLKRALVSRLHRTAWESVRSEVFSLPDELIQQLLSAYFRVGPINDAVEGHMATDWGRVSGDWSSTSAPAIEPFRIADQALTQYLQKTFSVAVPPSSQER